MTKSGGPMRQLGRALRERLELVVARVDGAILERRRAARPHPHDAADDAAEAAQSPAPAAREAVTAGSSPGAAARRVPRQAPRRPPSGPTDPAGRLVGRHRGQRGRVADIVPGLAPRAASAPRAGRSRPARGRCRSPSAPIELGHHGLEDLEHPARPLEVREHATAAALLRVPAAAQPMPAQAVTSLRRMARLALAGLDAGELAEAPRVVVAPGHRDAQAQVVRARRRRARG